MQCLCSPRKLFLQGMKLHLDNKDIKFENLLIFSFNFYINFFFSLKGVGHSVEKGCR